MKKLLLSCNHIGYSIGEKEVLRDISFSLFLGENIALVGPNGVGKSTLLKIITEIEQSDRGNIEYANNVKITYIPQEIDEEDSKLTVRNYIPNIKESDFFKLNLKINILDKQIADLSGGEKSKVNLIKMFSDKSDIYLLDEPTNNLDLKGLQILAAFIDSKKEKSSFIIVSHDRQFLEDMADKILEIDPYDKTGSIYPGKFSDYLLLRKQKIKNEWKKYDDYLAEKRFLEYSLQEKKQWSQKGEKGPQKTDNEKMARGNSKDWSGKILGKSVKIAQKKLDELKRVEKPREMNVITYDIPMRERSGDIVFYVEEVTKKYGNKIIGPIDLDIQFGDRLVITGDNGVGKTTLLKILMDRIDPDTGVIKRGNAIDIGYLPQESELKDEVLLSDIKKMDSDSETEFRKTLSNFGLTKEELKKSRNELSPGERSRFILALLISKKPNCLILDEPTNHLDVYALDFLEEAIRLYKGTVIIVTHDRYFMNRIGDYRMFVM